MRGWCGGGWKAASNYLALEPGPFDELTRRMLRTRELWNSRLDAPEAALRSEDAIEAARRKPDPKPRRKT